MNPPLFLCTTEPKHGYLISAREACHVACFGGQAVPHAPHEPPPEPRCSPETSLQLWPPHKALPGRHVGGQRCISRLPTAGTCSRLGSVLASQTAPSTGASGGTGSSILWNCWCRSWHGFVPGWPANPPRHGPGASSGHRLLPAGSLEGFFWGGERVREFVKHTNVNCTVPVGLQARKQSPILCT